MWAWIAGKGMETPRRTQPLSVGEDNMFTVRRAIGNDTGHPKLHAKVHTASKISLSAIIAQQCTEACNWCTLQCRSRDCVIGCNRLAMERFLVVLVPIDQGFKDKNGRALASRNRFLNLG